MFKEIALNPACLGEYHYYGLIKKDFGFEKGRYLILSARECAKEAMVAVKASTIQPVKKNFLNKLQKGDVFEGIFLPSDRSQKLEDNYGSWEQWWEAQIARRKFTATVSEKHLVNSISFEDILNHSDDWYVKPSIRVNKTPKDIVGSFISLLVLSENILIVVPFLSISSNNVLVDLFTRITQLPNLKNIVVATAIKTKNPAVPFKTYYERMLPAGVNFQLIEVQDKYFHDRYIY